LESKSFFFIGDVHGNFTNLKKALKKKKVKKEDCLVFLGDLINKGKENIEVLEFVEKWENKIIILGNHERVLIDYILNDAKYLSDFVNSCGGKWMSYVSEDVLKKWAHFFIDNSFYFLDFKIDGKIIGCCHASVPFDDWDKMKSNFKDVHPEIIWSFDRFNKFSDNKKVNPISNIDGVVFGHTPVKNITKVENTLYIDTGSFLEDPKKYEFGDITVIEIREIKKMLFDSE